MFVWLFLYFGEDSIKTLTLEDFKHQSCVWAPVKIDTSSKMKK